MELKDFVEKYGERYSELLGIDVDKEIFKWFLAALLFGAPIKEENAIRTYRVLEKYGYTSPEKIIEAGWDEIVRCLDKGGYTRYDFKTADKLMEACENLLKRGGIEKNIEGRKKRERFERVSKGNRRYNS
ncbi:MAG: hypothetical protein U9O96_06980 [Candidatus Thermoplasmatota archaeon]|nr:hypothetical protein [Candidatus Thermoplasmatota archaeon]